MIYVKLGMTRGGNMLNTTKFAHLIHITWQLAPKLANSRVSQHVLHCPVSISLHFSSQLHTEVLQQELCITLKL